MGTGVKFGYCFFDNYPYRLTLPGAPRRRCIRVAAPRIRCWSRRVSVGWGDIYRSSLPDQYIDITNLTAGRYRLQVTADKLGGSRNRTSRTTRPGSIFQFKGQGPPKIVGYGPAA